jgi:hypothetical protein
VVTFDRSVWFILWRSPERTLRNLFALKQAEEKKRTTLRGIAPDPNVPREETWEDETRLPRITREEVRGLFRR